MTDEELRELIALYDEFQDRAKAFYDRHWFYGCRLGFYNIDGAVIYTIKINGEEEERIVTSHEDKSFIEFMAVYGDLFHERHADIQRWRDRL
jgi:hypothetical protein